MSEVSFDKPAQLARRYFAPPASERTQYYSQCPGAAIASVTPAQFKGQNYALATEPYRGMPFINQGVGEGYGGGWPPQSSPEDVPNGDKTQIMAQASSNKCGITGKLPCAPVYRSSKAWSNIFTQWGQRGAFGKFDFRIPSKGNDTMELTKEGKACSAANPSYLACHKVQGLVDLK